MKKPTFLLIVLLFILTAFGQSNEKRIALVIGNSTYLHGGALKNPVSDANLMATTLQSLGFTVIKKLNASLRTMQLASTDFKTKLKDYDVALFFYAGHGIQVDGINYLIPVDAQLDNREMAKYDAFSINDINDAFMSNSSKTNIMILDACRNDPFRSWARGGDRGFAKIDNPSKGTIIAFATQPGETAADGSGSNGLYTSKLVQQMKISQSIENVFKNTRKAVNDASGGKQIPQDWSSLMDEFYFTGGKTVSNNNVEPENIVFNPGNVVILYGSISIDSEISGDLYIDGKKIGSINANSKGNKLNKIVTGSHIIEIRGTEIYKQTVEVDQNQTAYITANSSKQLTTNNKFKDLPDQLFDNRDNKYYKIVKIGNQIWMAENLAFNYGSGCWAYDNNLSNVTKYGYLYNWETAKYVCPSGWRLPSKSDFETLLNNVGGSGGSAYQALIPSGRSGFSAPFGGWRGSNGYVGYIGRSAFFWSSSTFDATYSWHLFIDSSSSNAYIYYYDKSSGLSVRCLQDN